MRFCGFHVQVTVRWGVEKKKNPHAQELRKLAGSKPGWARARNLSAERLSEIGRMGGLVGGPARARKLKAVKRQEIARKAVNARWAKAKAAQQGSARP
jgi:hypothetical protein